MKILVTEGVKRGVNMMPCPNRTRLLIRVSQVRDLYGLLKPYNL